MVLSGGRVSDESMLRLDLERDPEAPSLARAAISGFFEERGLTPEALTTLTLLVSELVSNAVIHSDAPPTSSIGLFARALKGGGARIEVTDQGSGFIPGPRDPHRHRGGYGLFLVDKEATRWGIERKNGVCVWFEIEASQRG